MMMSETVFYTDNIDSKAAREAVIQSIQQDEIVTLTPDSDDLDEVLSALRTACEDSVTYQSAGDHTGTVREFWGTDGDGDEWRVHVRMVAGKVRDMRDKITQLLQALALLADGAEERGDEYALRECSYALEELVRAMEERA